jgi:hypothetical protein
LFAKFVNSVIDTVDKNNLLPLNNHWCIANPGNQFDIGFKDTNDKCNNNNNNNNNFYFPQTGG